LHFFLCLNEDQDEKLNDYLQQNENGNDSQGPGEHFLIGGVLNFPKNRLFVLMSDFLPELVLIVEVLDTVMVNVFEGFFTDKMLFVDVFRGKDEVQWVFGRDGVVSLDSEDFVAVLVQVHLDGRVVLSHHPEVVQDGDELFSVSEKGVQIDDVLFVDFV
jgi:hypothetical protein